MIENIPKPNLRKDRPLSFTDCTSLALIEKSGIKQIMSFDSGFDGRIPSVC